MTGNRDKDFELADKMCGYEKRPDGYMWHHLDDYDVETNTCTMELVKEGANDATKPHMGSCAQYDKIHGKSYNK